jgi:galactokinase
MAITADMLLAVSVNGPATQESKQPAVVRIANVNETKFPSRQFDIPAEGDVSIDSSSLEWSNYFKCGLRAATQLLRQKKSDANFSPLGMDILADGTVPSGGGLSSSAAFVCASALAVLKANGEAEVDKKELVELAIVSERAVGVNSGG